MNSITDRQAGTSGALWLLVALLTVLASPAWSAACDAVFTNGAQSHSASGSITAGYQPSISGGSNVLSTPVLSQQSPPGQASCSGSVCQALGTPSALGSVTVLAGTGGDGAVVVDSNTNILEGDYTSITVNQDERATFNTENGTYYAQSLTTQYQSEVRFRAGDYWVDGDVTFGQETQIDRQGGGSDPVRLFVSGDVTIGYEAFTSDFEAGELLIYASGDVSIEQNAVLTAFIYASGSVAVGYGAQVTGAVAGSTVSLAQYSEILYPSGVLNDVEFAPLCGPGTDSPASIVSYWRMDEALWDGTSGEVLDVSGNSNHGTAQNGASTASAAPAIDGDPGTCGYGQLDGADDYISVPNLSDTLTQTASLAFWIKTEDVGSNSVWLSPAVTGVEENGGEDDIFWGWLNPQGRIGLAVGNDNTAVSSEVISGQGWKHVVITRNHDSGDYQIFVDGALDVSGNSRPGSIGNGFSSIGRVDNAGGGAPVYLQAELDEVRVYDGILTDTEVAAIYADTHPCSSVICPVSTPVPGLLGEYFENETLSGEAATTRVDAPVQFSWENNEGPSVLGGRANDFSIRWEGRLYVTETGNYRFRTLSDDGVRLWVDGQRVINNWGDHSVQTNTTGPIELQSEQAYDIRLEFYENGGRAQIELLWSTPSNGSYFPIPAGDDAGTLQGLYHCPGSQVANYLLAHSGSGVTCEALQVVITAVDSAGNAVAPPAGTEIVLGTTPSTAEIPWANGENTYQFSGLESTVTKYLQWDAEGEVSLSVTDGTIQNSSGPINFSDVGLLFYDSLADRNGSIPTQVAGLQDPAPVIRAVKASDEKEGACIARLSGQTRSVGLAFECRNPGSCVTGQVFDVGGTPIAANNIGEPVTYSAVDLLFDSEGFASIPLTYSDVGQVRLYAQLALPEEPPQPAETLVGSSNEFVVKPHSLRVASVQTLAGAESPGTDSSVDTQADDDAFVAAGEPFSVTVEALNAQDNVTPNFGNENSPENVRLELTTLSYPTGGDLGSLGGESSFSPEGGGYSSSDTVTWDNVGAIIVTPRLLGDDYLSAGDLFELTASNPIGRFYPWEHAVTGSSSEDTCITGAFSYLQQNALELGVTLEARNRGGNNVTNYDTDLGYQQVAAPVSSGHVAENADSANGDVFDGRVLATFEGKWTNGTGQFDTNTAMLARTGQPDGPWPSLRIGLTALSDPDNRPLTGYDMNANTTGDCTASDNCNAVALGDTLEFRFGRLTLEDAFGPEVVDLAAPFYIEYWDGTEFIRNADDSCTRIPRSAITYEPTGPLTDDGNRTVPIGGGTTTGKYNNLDTVGVNISNSYSDQTFTAPGAGNTGSFDILVNLTERPWLIFDWNQDGDHNNDINMPPANVGFGSYRGHDRIIYWREVLE